MRLGSNIASMVLVAFSLCGLGAGGSVYEVEYKFPIADAGTLDVVFHVAVSAKQAESVLRREMQNAIEVKKPTVDVVISAWDGRSKARGQEDMITLSDGSDTLVYIAKTGELVTYNAFERMKKH